MDQNCRTTSVSGRLYRAQRIARARMSSRTGVGQRLTIEQVGARRTRHSDTDERREDFVQRTVSR